MKQKENLEFGVEQSRKKKAWKTWEAFSVNNIILANFSTHLHATSTYQNSFEYSALKGTLMQI